MHDTPKWPFLNLAASLISTVRLVCSIFHSSSRFLSKCHVIRQPTTAFNTQNELTGFASSVLLEVFITRHTAKSHASEHLCMRSREQYGNHQSASVRRIFWGGFHPRRQVAIIDEERLVLLRSSQMRLNNNELSHARYLSTGVIAF